MRDVLTAPGILLIGNDPTERHPLLAWQIRTNIRLNGGRLHVINSQEIKLLRQASASAKNAAGTEGKALSFLAGDDKAPDAASRPALSTLRDKVPAEPQLNVNLSP